MSPLGLHNFKTAAKISCATSQFSLTFLASGCHRKTFIHSCWRKYFLLFPAISGCFLLWFYVRYQSQFANRLGNLGQPECLGSFDTDPCVRPSHGSRCHVSGKVLSRGYGTLNKWHITMQGTRVVTQACNDG